MTATPRPYNRAVDYDRVGRFLVETYDPAAIHVNWLRPRWEYMHYHPFIRDLDLTCIGVWEEGGGIVAVAHPEHALGPAYFQLHPDHAALKKDMLAYAEEHIAAERDGAKTLRIFVNDRDAEFQRLAADRGYEQQSGGEPMSHLPIPDPFPAIALPDGFRLQSLADDNDLLKLDRLLFRGFDHGDEPLEDGLDDRRFMQSAPNYDRDLNVVVVAPGGEFVSYCGMWIEPVHRLAYVEPVCTDPDYRRRGLASAAVREGMRRCGERGATLACVGATRPLYLSIGFRPVYNSTAWRRTWT